MSDTGEQGMTPQDPAERAGVGGGIIPDDQGEGYEQAAQVLRRKGDGNDGDGSGESGEQQHGKPAGTEG